MSKATQDYMTVDLRSLVLCKGCGSLVDYWKIPEHSAFHRQIDKATQATSQQPSFIPPF